jgi:acyl-CoA synthetase (AMP-forming)/AMP-acid ligase II
MPDVESVMAISVPHDVLQEAVGICLTMQPDIAHPSLQEIQSYISGSLHPSKWPQLVVYMDGGLPLTVTNKVNIIAGLLPNCQPAHSSTQKTLWNIVLANYVFF